MTEGWGTASSPATEGREKNSCKTNRLNSIAGELQAEVGWRTCGKTNRPRVWSDTEGARNIVRGHSVQGKTRVYWDSERTLTRFLSLGPVLVFTLQHIVSPSKPWNSHYRPLGGSSYRQTHHSTAELCTFTALIKSLWKQEIWKICKYQKGSGELFDLYIYKVERLLCGVTRLYVVSSHKTDRFLFNPNWSTLPAQINFLHPWFISGSLIQSDVNAISG